MPDECLVSSVFAISRERRLRSAVSTTDARLQRMVASWMEASHWHGTVLDDSPAHVDLEQNVDSGNMRRRRAPALAFHKSRPSDHFGMASAHRETHSPTHTSQPIAGGPYDANDRWRSNKCRLGRNVECCPTVAVNTTPPPVALPLALLNVPCRNSRSHSKSP